MENNNIKVSICVLAYNHAAYIKDCLEGILMQQRNFEIEILIHDDASTDGTTDIIRMYETKYPNIVKPIYESENQYSKGYAGHMDDTFNIPRAQGSYIAFCEGDDYWIDPLKLQKQIDILDADGTLMAVVCNSQKVDLKGELLEQRYNNITPNNENGRITLRDFFNQNPVYPTATVMFRNRNLDKILSMTSVTANPYLGDWTLWIILHTFGDFYYIDDVTAAYRINPTSVTHSKVDERRLGLAKANFKIIKNVASILPEEYADIRDNLLHEKGWLWFNLANAYKHVHKYFLMAGCLLICGILDPKLLYQKLKGRKNR